MLHRIRTYLFALGLFWTAALEAQTLSDEARISLLTCAPGEELYARFGHTALRVTDPAHHLDAVFNYGVFDFNTDHFYWKYFEGWDITHDPSVEQREVFRARKDFENQKTKDYNAFIRKFY